MKKKVLYAVCAVAVVAAIIGMLIFAFGGNDDEKYPNNKEAVDIVGAWEVIAVVQNEVPAFVDNEYMVFDAEKVSGFKNGEAEPYLTSQYAVSKDNIMELSDIGRKFTIDNKNRDYIRLYENADKYRILIRCPNADMTAPVVKQESIVGRWNVEYRSGGPAEEILEFTNDTLYDYQNGSNEPAFVSSYSWKDANTFFADKLNKDLDYHPLSDTRAVLVEIDNGNIWVLAKAAG